jgi:hypothetical protein
VLCEEKYELKEKLMEKGHKQGTSTFEELNYSEQAKSISAQILNLEASIKANIRRADKEGKENPKEKRIKNLEDLIGRIKEYNV